MTAVRGWRLSSRGMTVAGGGGLLIAGVVTVLLLSGNGSGAMASPAPSVTSSRTAAVTGTAATTSATPRAGSTARAGTPNPSQGSGAKPVRPSSTTGAVPAKSQLTREQAASQAEAALRAFLAVSDKALLIADDSVPGVSRFASPSVVGEVRGAASDLATQLFHQRGAVRVKSVTAHRTRLEPPASVTLYACLDLTGIDIVDSENTVVRDGAATRPVLNHYDVQRASRGWIVTAHSLPGDTAC